MNERKLSKMVNAGNDLIESLRLESDVDSEDSFWILEEEHIKWINGKDLVNLTQLAYEFSNRCLDLEDEVHDKEE